jgi:hypothetical protein
MNAQLRQVTGDSRHWAGRLPSSANPAKSPAPSQDAIRLRAYLKWQAAGKPTGNDLFFWVHAERELYRRA